jgi:hypothetical protein
MAKTGRQAQGKIHRMMHEAKKGMLRSGSTGRKVTSRKQALAVASSEAPKAGGEVPPKPKANARSRKSTRKSR